MYTVSDSATCVPNLKRRYLHIGRPGHCPVQPNMKWATHQVKCNDIFFLVGRFFNLNLAAYYNYHFKLFSMQVSTIYTTLTNFSTKYLVMYKVYTHVGGLKLLYHVCPPVRKIIHELKLVDYLHVQADNPWYYLYMSIISLVNTLLLYNTDILKKHGKRLRIQPRRNSYRQRISAV